MASTNAKKAAPKQLIKFQAFPRETIRAAEAILDQLDIDVGNSKYKQFSIHRDKTSNYLSGNHWPVTVKVGSSLWKDLHEIVMYTQTCFANEGMWRNEVSIEFPEYDRYLTPLPAFYDHLLEVDEDGSVISGEVLSLRRPDDVPPQKKLLGHWEYHDLVTGTVMENFRWLLLAAKFKSELFLELSSRTANWYEVVEDILERLPCELNIDVKGMACAVDLENLPTKEKFENVSSHGNDTGAAHEDSNTDASSTTARLTPSEHATEVPANNTGCNSNELELSYTATLRVGNETVTIQISLTRVGGPEEKVLDTTKEMWTWMVERGMDDKTSLGEVVELARKMVLKQEGGLADA